MGLLDFGEGDGGIELGGEGQLGYSRLGVLGIRTAARPDRGEADDRGDAT